MIKVDLSVIVVNYKSWGKLEKCLHALAEIDPTQVNMEVIIVDNGSADGKIDQFRSAFPKVQFLVNTGNNGFANANNLGFAASKGDYLLFLNPDTLVNEAAILEMLKECQHGSTPKIVSCKQVRPNGKIDRPFGYFPDWFTLSGWSRGISKFFHLIKPYEESQSIIYPDWISGSVVMISRKWFIQTKGWNDGFWMYYEDVDLCSRIRAIDGRVILLNDVSIIHDHGGSSRINVSVAGLTKSEVNISRHYYVFLHFSGIKHSMLQGILILEQLLFGIFPALLGLVFFWNNRCWLKPLVYYRMLRYYVGVLFSQSWMSPRSVNHKNFLQSSQFSEAGFIAIE